MSAQDKIRMLSQLINDALYEALDRGDFGPERQLRVPLDPQARVARHTKVVVDSDDKHYILTLHLRAETQPGIVAKVAFSGAGNHACVEEKEGS